MENIQSNRSKQSTPPISVFDVNETLVDQKDSTRIATAGLVDQAALLAAPDIRIRE